MTRSPGKRTKRSRKETVPLNAPQGTFVQDLHKRKEILISVPGRRSGRVYTFPVWFAVQGETLWLLPVRGKRTQWYRNVQVHPAIEIRSGHLRRSFVARQVDHSKTVGAVLAAFRKKYTAPTVARYYPTPDVALEVPLNPRYSSVTPT